MGVRDVVGSLGGWLDGEGAWDVAHPGSVESAVVRENVDPSNTAYSSPATQEDEYYGRMSGTSTDEDYYTTTELLALDQGRPLPTLILLKRCV